MVDSNVWLPHLDLLQLAYENNKSYFHSLNHALRVWSLSLLLSEKHQDLIDIDALSAGALFHEVGRESDWNKSENSRNSTKWVRENLPIIEPNFTETQLNLIEILCARVDESDVLLAPLELKILKDAQELDKHRLIRSKVNESSLLLPESSEYIDFSKDFYQKWKKNSSKGNSTPYQILKETLRETPELRKYSNLIDLDQEHIYLRKKYLNAFERLENYLQKLEGTTSKFYSNLKDGSLEISHIKELDDILRALESITIENCTTCEAAHYRASELIRDCLKRSLPDNTISGKERKAIKRIYKKVQEKTSEPFISEIDITSLSFLFSKSNLKNRLLVSSVKNFLALNDKLDHLLVSINFSEKKYRRMLVRTFDKKDMKLADFEFDYHATKISRERWVWIKAIREWISNCDNLICKNEHDFANRIIIYSIHIIKQLISMERLSTAEITQIQNLVTDINLLSPREKLEVDSKEIFSLIQNDFISSDGLSEIVGGAIHPNCNIFHLYDGDPKETEAFFNTFEGMLLSFAKRGEDIDATVRNYLLPAALNNEFNYSINEGLFKALNDEAIKVLIEKYNTITKKNPDSNIQGLTYIYTSEKSKKNVKALTSLTKHHALIQTKNDYKIASKILNFDILDSILKNNSFFLSSFNIVNVNPKSMVYKSSDEPNHKKSVQTLDVRQREMLIRRPDIMRDHNYLGTLQNLKDLLSKEDLLDSVPSPADYIPKRRFGKIIIIFKDYLKDRTLFTMHDSVWEHSTVPVLFDDAKYLYEEINSEKLSSKDDLVKSATKKAFTPFVEANILGGVDLKDVEMIIAPKKVIQRRRDLIDMLLEQYHDIEVMGI